MLCINQDTHQGIGCSELHSEPRMESLLATSPRWRGTGKGQLGLRNIEILCRSQSPGVMPGPTPAHHIDNVVQTIWLIGCNSHPNRKDILTFEISAIYDIRKWTFFPLH